MRGPLLFVLALGLVSQGCQQSTTDSQRTAAAVTVPAIGSGHGLTSGPPGLATTLAPGVAPSPSPSASPSPSPSPNAFHFLSGTDKWWVDASSDFDGDGAPDLTSGLAKAKNDQGGLGFADTSQAGRLLLSFVSQFYGNAPDGTLAPQGAKLSFQLERPSAGKAPPLASEAPPTSTDDYNVMAVRNTTNTPPPPGVLGTGLQDTRNQQLEHDAGQDMGEPLGVFLDKVIVEWNQNPIPDTSRTLPELMQELALITAHEIGHSLGLDHVETVPGNGELNIMSASGAVDPRNRYAFDSATFTQLLSWLPGTNRCRTRSSLSVRRLMAEADAVVVGTPLRVQEGTMDLQVERVLSGGSGTGFVRVQGFPTSTQVEPARMNGTGPCLMFLTRNAAGALEVGLGKLSALPLTGHDPAEWTARVNAYQALDQLSGAAWNAGAATALTDSLASSDPALRADALLDLSTLPEVVHGLTAQQSAAVCGALRASSPQERGLAARVLTQEADPSLAPSLLQAALQEDQPQVLATLAGALETSLGLQAAADQVRAQLPDLDARGIQRATTLLGWLQDRESVPMIAADLRADPARACRAADALAAMHASEALEDLQTLASDAGADTTARMHALRAIGRLGTASDWLSAATQTLETDALRNGARYARDYPQSWLIR